VTDSEGHGLAVQALGKALNVTALNFDPMLLDEAYTKHNRHTNEIHPDRHSTFLRIDLGQRGLGGDDSWHSLPMDKYRLLDKSYGYSFILSPAGK
ncbi:MAG: hypothetical protein K2F63_00330, partial [Muribaculaceae bacterium]|nr:hypothetical protein [Muribaculaceae bacterium]